MKKSKYVSTQQAVLKLLRASLKTSEISGLQVYYEANKSNEVDKKSAIEQSLRELIMKHHITDLPTIEKLINLSIEIAKADLISYTCPVTLLVDVFDVKPLDSCEVLFKFVEDNVSVFKEDTFFTPCKNHLLRMCNDLLRRLSRSQNTVFCGRILLFLAKFFPFSERSGLNIVSEFNVDNITEFGSTDGELKESLDESEENQLKIDYHLYLKFWTLQEFFRCPNICYDREQWKKFIGNTSDVLSAFSSFKLEDSSDSKSAKKIDDKDFDENIVEMAKNEVEESQHFFAKFLTNPKLLALQLSDSNFRRTVLVQYLVLFQYLTSTVKFKTDTDILTTGQTEWLNETEVTIYKLLGETPPQGKRFSETVKHVLKREEMWNNWKNDGCKEITRPDNSGSKPVIAARPKRKMLGDQIAEATKKGKFHMDNPELTRLWNLCPDNLQACKGSDRNFLPILEHYLENPKEKTDTTYEWRALRLLSRQSPHFFTMFTTPCSKISDYIEFVHKKLQKEKSELRSEASEEMITAIQIENDNFAEDVGDVGETMEDTDNLATEETDETHKPTAATPEQIVDISKSVGTNWRKLGLKLGYTADVLDFYATQTTSIVDQCKKMLVQWFEEDDDANLDNLAYICEGLKILKAAGMIKKMIGTDVVVEEVQVSDD